MDLRSLPNVRLTQGIGKQWPCMVPHPQPLLGIDSPRYLFGVRVVFSQSNGTKGSYIKSGVNVTGLAIPGKRAATGPYTTAGPTSITHGTGWALRTGLAGDGTRLNRHDAKRGYQKGECREVEKNAVISTPKNTKEPPGLTTKRNNRMGSEQQQQRWMPPTREGKTSQVATGRRRGDIFFAEAKTPGRCP